MAQLIRIKRTGLAALKNRALNIFQSNKEDQEEEEKKLREIFKSKEEEEDARKRKA